MAQTPVTVYLPYPPAISASISKYSTERSFIEIEFSGTLV
jgi:hypothetical protein